MGISQNELRQINERFEAQEAKAVALQFMVCQNLAAQYAMAGINGAQIMENHNGLRAIFQKLTFAKLDPATSDAWADEIQRALDALLTQIEKSYRNRLGE